MRPFPDRRQGQDFDAKGTNAFPMLDRGPGRTLTRLVIAAAVGAIAWFTVGQSALEKINKSNERTSGGGPLGQRIVSARRFAPIVAQLKRAVGSEVQLSVVTLRPDSVEFEVVQGGRARGYRYRDGHDRLETYDVGTTGRRGQPSNRSYRMSLLDPRAPERITRAISTAEHGDFRLSIGDLQRAETGRLVWTMRGRVGERGVAWYAPSRGSPIKPFDPSKPELSKGAALADCISRAHSDVAKVQRCVARFSGP